MGRPAVGDLVVAFGDPDGEASCARPGAVRSEECPHREGLDERGRWLGTSACLGEPRRNSHLVRDLDADLRIVAIRVRLGDIEASSAQPLHCGDVTSHGETSSLTWSALVLVVVR